MRARLQRTTKFLFVAGTYLALVGCTGADGVDGANGTDGTSCTATDDGAGTTTITCDDGTTATVANGTNGTNGTNGANGDSCTVADNGDGTMTISCDDGTTATVANGTNCTVANDGAGTTTISCDDGTSSTVTDGQDVDPATVDDLQAQLDELAKVGPESCATCHEGAGEHHQANYDDYSDASDLVLTFVAVDSVDNGGSYDVTMTFDITWKGLPYEDIDGLPGLNQKRFYTIRWDGTGYYDSKSFGNIQATATPGRYTASATGLTYAPEDENGVAYGYIAEGLLPKEPASGHVTLYDNVSNAGMAFGTAGDYESAATVEGCQKCHGAPYRKHGYRAARVDGLPDFTACKACHYDDRNGGHFDWQILVDDPVREAEIFFGDSVTDAEKTQYAYTANVMNDVHMSHAMEFPYPQSMANCTVCHEGKLDMVLDNSNFKLSTCKSCHAVTGSEDYGTADHALMTLWNDVNQLPLHQNLTDASDCTTCHDGSTAPMFDQYHTGYNSVIYADPDVKYSELFTVTIDEATVSGDTLTVKFSAHEDGASTSTLDATDIVPTLLVGLYGYDTKDFIVSPHSRDEDHNRLLELTIDGETTNPRLTVVSSSNGSYEVDVDLSMWNGMITDGVVKRAEIAVEPALTDADGVQYALNAVSRTFDLATGFDDGYFDDIVDVNKCNACHEALATTFHHPDRGGSVRVCRLCHVPTSGASHLEMQSRSIDSYVHAIHSFQGFDPGDVDFTDQVEAMRYDMHIEHTYPTFTAQACESCHNEGTFGVPDQGKSMPGLLSGSDTVDGRAIHDVPAYVTGPAARACGGCHRTEFINEDDANGLLAFNSHIKRNGYLMEDSDGLLNMVIETIMAMF